MNIAIQDISIRVREVLSRHGGLAKPIEEIDEDAPLSDAGMTSHANVNVMLALEAVFGEMPERMLTRSVFRSIASITGAMRELVDQQS